MDDNTRLTSVVFRLNRDRLESLKDLSKETRIRQSEYLREAISDLLEKYEDKLMDASVEKGGPRGTSRASRRSCAVKGSSAGGYSTLHNTSPAAGARSP